MLSPNLALPVLSLQCWDAWPRLTKPRVSPQSNSKNGDLRATYFSFLEWSPKLVKAFVGALYPSSNFLLT